MENMKNAPGIAINLLKYQSPEFLYAKESYKSYLFFFLYFLWFTQINLLIESECVRSYPLKSFGIVQKEPDSSPTLNLAHRYASRALSVGTVCKQTPLAFC